MNEPTIADYELITAIEKATNNDKYRKGKED